MKVFANNNPWKALLALIVAALFSIGLAGCNTTAGFGEDMEAAGDAIEGKAEKEKRY